MCGLTGFLDASGAMAAEAMARVIEAMATTIHHRGPDDGGSWIDPSAGIALGSRRLAIVDLSQEGHQPMFSASGRYVIAFNGEIYNYREIREELDQLGARWRGGSDTEVLLAAVERWGLEAALKRTVGMYALALWDRNERVLRLARDRMGEKPLYYGWFGSTLLFGSELKTFRPHPRFEPAVDRGAVALFLRHGYVPSPWSIFENVRKLPPAAIATIPERAGPAEMTISSYWSAGEAAARGQRQPFSGDESEAKAALDACLRRSVREQMVADVPVGAFLSGGIDSSTLVALMQALGDRPTRTFTIGFNEGEFNESEHARAVAAHLGAEHTELYVSPEDALNVIPHLPRIYDEPFADPSQIPTAALARLTRRHVTVSLSGDGGDELFGGYERYFRAERLRAMAGRVPGPMRWATLAGSNLAPERFVPRRVGEVAELLADPREETIYRSRMTTWPEAESVAIGADRRATAFADPAAWTAVDGYANRMMHLDQISYLPDDILVKVDRASMAASLESRAPFLDHRVVEFAWSLPLSMKMRDGTGKWLLRRVLDDYVPASLIDRPKMGFGIPLAAWLRGPLRAWAEELLDEGRLSREGFLDPKPIRAAWAEHLAGVRDCRYRLWTVLMFQAWRDDLMSNQTEWAAPSERELAVVG
jgi:asparagine synthase (glutamine-hydrolysing)